MWEQVSVSGCGDRWLAGGCGDRCLSVDVGTCVSVDVGTGNSSVPLEGVISEVTGMSGNHTPHIEA